MRPLAVSAEGFPGRLVVIGLLILGSGAALEAEDCNSNCIDDSLEVQEGAPDCNRNQVLDECEMRLPGADFTESPVVHPGGSVESLVVADIDGDGLDDLATGNATLTDRAMGTGVTIHWNMGGGKLEAAVSYLIPWVVPGTLLVQDIDGDGDRDVALAVRPSRLDCSAQQSGRVHVIENRGGRVLSRPITREAGPVPVALGASDLDGDGDTDLAVANAWRPLGGGGSIFILLSRGGLNYEATVRVDAGEDEPAGMSIGDLDGDGDPDVAVVQRSGAIDLIRNGGGGALAPAARIETGGPLEWIQGADLDLDGDIDLLAGRKGVERGPPLLVLRNAGGSTFERVDLEGGSAPASAVDLDGDALPELIAAVEGRLHVLRNAGSASFTAAEMYELPWNASELAGAGEIAEGRVDILAGGPSDLAVVRIDSGVPKLPLVVSTMSRPGAAGDLDGDGDIDLASLEENLGLLEILQNPGNGRFPRNGGRSFDAPDNITSIAVGDIDRDGDLDLAGGLSSSSSLTIFRNQGDANLTVESYDPDGAAFELRRSELGDLDGDGDLDALLGASFGVQVFGNLGEGSFERGGRLLLGSEPVSIAARDLDRDGDIDLATANLPVLESSNVSVLTNAGGGAFLPARNYAIPAPPTWLGLGDLDRDGYLDIVTNGPAVLRSLAGTHFDGARLQGTDQVCEGVLLDVDGDGALDVVSAKGRVHRNRGDGSLVPSAFVWHCNEVSRMLTADIDGDGDLDIVEGGSGLSVAFSGGDGLPYPIPAPAPNAGHLLEIADTDRDGDRDVLIGGGSSIALLENHDGSGRFASAVWGHLQPSEYAEALVSADLDGNGWTDQAVVHGCLLPACGRKLTVFFGSSSGLEAVATNDLDVITENVSPGHSVVWNVSASDLDGDGDPDLFGTYGYCLGDDCRYGAYVIWNDGQRSFSPVGLPGLPHFAPSAAAGDIDRDGDMDIVTDRLSFFRNRGDASFEAPSSPHAPESCCGLALGDLDADGDLDAVLKEAAFLNAGDGRSFEPIPLGGALETLAPLGDIDGDDDLDLVGSVGNGPLKFLVVFGNDGRGKLEASIVLSAISTRPLPGIALADMNGDGRLDILANSVGALLVRYGAMASSLEPGRDLNASGRLDACEVPFIRGDVTGDSRLDMSDPISILRFLFLGEEPPSCLQAADVNNDTRVNITDAVELLNHLFLGGPPPAPPRDCGIDRSHSDVECESHPAC